MSTVNFQKKLKIIGLKQADNLAESLKFTKTSRVPGFTPYLTTIIR